MAMFEFKNEKEQNHKMGSALCIYGAELIFLQGDKSSEMLGK